MTLCSQRDAWLDGRLEPEKSEAYQAHLASCSECRAAVNAWHLFRRGLSESEAFAPAPVTDMQAARLVARARDTSPARLRLWIPAGAFALAAALVAWVTMWNKQEAPQPWEARVVASTEATVSATKAETAEKGRALLDVGADRIGLASATQLHIDRADTRATRLNLRKGTMAARVEHGRGKRDFLVHTPLGDVHVVGTEFRVIASEVALTVEVLVGAVEVRPLNGPRAQVKAGERWSLQQNEQRLEDLEAQRFTELELVEPATESLPAVAETKDAGPALDAGSLVTKKSVRPEAPLAEWRQRAARNECRQVSQEARRFLAKQPQESGAWLVIGDCQRRANRFSAAVTAYLEAGKQRGPDAETGMLLAASVLQDQLKQHSRALKTLDALVARKPSPAIEAAALVRQARAYQALEKPARARALLQRVVKEFEDTPSAAEAARLLSTHP